MNQNSAMVAIIAVISAMAVALFGSAMLVSYARQPQTDPYAAQICDPYPAFSSFNKDGVVYAVCVQPDAGLVAKRIR